MPINFMMTREKDTILAATNETWEDLDFKVALDSGSVVTFARQQTAPDTSYRNRQGVGEAISS